MIKRLLSSKSNTITGAAILLGGASFASRLLGVLRDRALAHTFGAGEMLDAYFTAFRIPDLVYNLAIAGALTAGFIPLFTELFEKNKKEAWMFTSRVITLLGSAVIVLCGLLLVFAGPLTELIAPGFSLEQQALTTTLSRLLLLSPIILGISAIISGVLQSLRFFLVYALCPIVYNLGIIIGAVVFSRFWGIQGVTYGVILGALMHLLIQLPTAWSAGMRLRVRFTITKNIRTLLSMMIPRTLSLATYQVVLLVLTIMATKLASGSVSIFNFANNIHFFPIGMVGISFALAAFPVLSKTAARNDRPLFIHTISGAARVILFLIVPITVLFLLLRAEMVRIILGSGEFDWTATVRTADTLAFFAVGLFAQTLLPLLSRGFWALKDSKTPFYASLIGAIVTIGSAKFLVPLLESGSEIPGNGIVALGAAFALGGIVNLIILWMSLHRRVHTLNESRILFSLLRISIAGVIMAFFVQISKEWIGGMVDMQTFVGVFIKLAAASIIGLAIYALSTHLLKSPEMHRLYKAARKRWMKFSGVQEMEL